MTLTRTGGISPSSQSCSVASAVQASAMASNLTAQVRNIAEVATAIAGGDLSKKITVNVSGEILQLKETLNTMRPRSSPSR